MNAAHKTMIRAAKFAGSWAQHSDGIVNNVDCDRRRLRSGRIAAAIVFGILVRMPTAGAQVANWISSWTASPQAPRGVIPGSFSNRTIRQIVHLSVGGNKVRLRLSNEFGQRPVLIGAAAIALAGQGVGIAAESSRSVTFGGTKSVIIPPGAPALSDPVVLEVAPLSDIAVSLYLPAATDLSTVHATGLQTGYVSSSGDYTASAEFPVADRFANRFFLTGVMVEPTTPVRAIVAFGDSITDGTASTVNANHCWPDVLACCRRFGHPKAIASAFDSGDHLHPSDAGYKAMADAIDLKLFQ